MQLSTGLFICVASIMLYSMFSPYTARTDDALQLFCQVELFLTLLAGMMLKIDRSITASSVASSSGEESQAEAIGVWLVLLNASTFVVAMIAVVVEVLDMAGVWERWTSSLRRKRRRKRVAERAATKFKAMLDRKRNKIAPVGGPVSDEVVGLEDASLRDNVVKYGMAVALCAMNVGIMVTLVVAFVKAKIKAKFGKSGKLGGKVAPNELMKALDASLGGGDDGRG